MRDHTKLRVFALADNLVLAVYRASSGFPKSEQHGLHSQMRRAAVSIAANIVEGCARSTQKEYVRFVEIAYGSARELEYEISLCDRLGYLTAGPSVDLHNQCVATAKGLNGLLRAFRET
jgi:four helix bundle protein